jgi:hypothetical protein
MVLQTQKGGQVAMPKNNEAQILALGCWVCRRQGIYSPALKHHVRRLATSKKRKLSPIIPLCWQHHDGGVYGLAIHSGRQAWEANFGSEVEMVKEVQDYLAWAKNRLT